MFGTLASATAIYQIAPSKDPLARTSLTTAYVAIVLLTATLVLGPIKALTGRRQPLSNDFRRDVGIWTAIWAVVHSIVGLQVHLRGRMLEYFIQPGDKPLLVRLRSDLFGLANYSGLLATLLVLMLAAISNDWSLSRLGASRWKRLQQMNYVLFAVVVGHAMLYQLVEKRSPPFAFVIGFLTATAIMLQSVRSILVANARA